MKPQATRATVVLVALLGLAACSQPPYGPNEARADLVEAGYTNAEADCLLDGLDAYFRDEFLGRQLAGGVDPESMPERQADIFVKNRFAGNGKVPPDLPQEAERLKRACRTAPA